MAAGVPGRMPGSSPVPARGATKQSHRKRNPPDGTTTSRQPSLSNHTDAHAAIIGHSKSVIFAAHDMPVSSVSA